jgi:cytochrome c oxidase subunit 2
VVFVAVVVAMLLAVWRSPRAQADTAADISGLSRVERGPRTAVIAATAVSVIGLTGLLLASIFTDRALAALDLQGAVHLEVVAHQWWWDIHYDDPQPSKAFSTANEMHIPVGRPVIVTLKSDDVIHSFWVPNLHGKRDLIPGYTTSISFRADKAGTYRGQCAEFCGLQHAFMAFTVVAEAPERFAAWAEAQRKPAPEPAEAAQKRGRELFLTGPCVMCHAIAGTTAAARKAPDLTHIATRPTLGAGTIGNNEANLAAWITDPQKIKPGVNMPANPLKPEDLKALVAYLESLE